MNDFLPTYLMVKRHRKTGLLYFCKTIRKNPEKYKGSGVRWALHMKVHGRDVENLWHQLFIDKEDLQEFALFFSEYFNIVENKNWANLVPEDGITGWPPGTKHTEETKKICAEFGKKYGFKKGYTPFNKDMKMDETFCETQRKNNKERIDNGTHNFLTEEFKNAARAAESKRLEVISRKVVVDGIVYSSAREAARQLDIYYHTVIKRIESVHNMDYQWLDSPKQPAPSKKRNGLASRPVTIEGIIYSGAWDAALTLGLTKAAVKARIRNKNYPTYVYAD